MADVASHSIKFPGFLTFSHCLYFSLSASFYDCVEKPLQLVLATPCLAFFALSFAFLPNLPFWLSSLYVNIKHLIWCKLSKTSTVCFQPSCHRLIPLLSVYSGICVRKYILGWLIPPRLIFAAGWWFPAALRCIFVWRAIFENKFCLWYKSGR